MAMIKALAYHIFCWISVFHPDVDGQITQKQRHIEQTERKKNFFFFDEFCDEKLCFSHSHRHII